MNADEYQAALEVLELAREALAARGNTERRLIEAYLCLYATVEEMKPDVQPAKEP
ncbi:MAG TPA: hypothetical protein VH143_32800 [Kofleriaceae bacterium]|jgi:hypothetical protein|nr:hypothetical protein [Kofleriaceae bacterium]